MAISEQGSDPERLERAATGEVALNAALAELFQALMGPASVDEISFLDEEQRLQALAAGVDSALLKGTPPPACWRQWRPYWSALAINGIIAGFDTAPRICYTCLDI